MAWWRGAAGRQHRSDKAYAAQTVLHIRRANGEESRKRAELHGPMSQRPP